MRVLPLCVAGAVVIGAFLLGGLVTAGAPEEESLKVDALFAAVAHCPGPGAAVLVVRDGKIVHEKGYFDQALYSEKLLKAATLEQAFTPTTLTDGRIAPYGLGWMVQPYRGLKEVAHGGDITGFNAYFARFPEQRYTVIVLSNLSMRPSGPIPTAIDLAHHIADVYLGDQMPSAEPPKVIEVDPKVLRTYAGQYRLAGPPEILEVTGDTLAVACEEGRLFIEAKQGRYEMVPESEKTFRILEFGTGVTFLRDDKGQVNEVIVAIMGLKELSATRIQ